MLHHYLALGFAVVCLSQAAALARLAQAPPEVIGFWRLLGAAILLGAWSLIRGRSLEATPPTESAFQQPSMRLSPVSLSVLSGMCFFLHLWSFTFAAQHTSILHCMLLFSTHPLWTAGIARWAHSDPLPSQAWLSYLLFFAGIWILFSGSDGATSMHTQDSLTFTLWGYTVLWGDLAAAASAVTYSGYLLIGKPARLQIGNLPYTLRVYAVAVAMFALVAIFHGTSLLNSLHFYPTGLAIFGLIVFPTLCGHFLFSYLMKWLNLHLMSLTKLSEPALAGLLAWVIWGDQLGWNSLAALVLAAMALWLLLRSAKTL